jgi:DNA-directed RNA polymerase specialized sigma24 family protein
MDDREVAAAIASGDPAGIAIAYDRYAAGLYGYCHWMLQQSPAAADALRDAFVTTANRLGNRGAGSATLRPLLYAAARDQCRHRLRAMLAVGGPLADADPDPGAAARDMKPPEREVIELTLRHNLDDADLATVLAVSRRRAHARAERACALAARCTDRAEHEMAELPPDLREEVLRVCSSPADDAVAYRRRLAGRRYTIMAPVAWVGLVWAVGLVLLMFTGSQPSHALASAGSSVSADGSPATAATSPSTPTTPPTHASAKRSPTISRSPAQVPPATTPPASPAIRTSAPPKPSHSASPTHSPSPSQSATPSRSPSPKPTHSPSPSPSPTVTPTPT